MFGARRDDDDNPCDLTEATGGMAHRAASRVRKSELSCQRRCVYLTGLAGPMFACKSQLYCCRATRQ